MRQQETEIETERHTHRVRQTDRQTDRDRDTQRDRDREKQRERESVAHPSLLAEEWMLSLFKGQGLITQMDCRRNLQSVGKQSQWKRGKHPGDQSETAATEPTHPPTHPATQPAAAEAWPPREKTMVWSVTTFTSPSLSRNGIFIIPGTHWKRTTSSGKSNSLTRILRNHTL